MGKGRSKKEEVKSKIAYILTSGTYSDYGIEAIFSTKLLSEEAQKVLKTFRSYDDSRIEEYRIFEEVPQPYMMYIVEKIDQKVKSNSHLVLGWEVGENSYVGRIRDGVGFHKWMLGKRLCYRAWGRDKAAVEKRFYEFHNQQIADQAP